MDEIKDLVCPICGEPTNVYMGKARKDRLCKKHGMKRNAGEIDVNEDGFFFEIVTGTILNPPKAEKKPEPVKETKNGADELTCIICGEPSNGKHFCIKCYKKYKEKDVLIKVHKCEFPTGEPLDESYEGVYECEDGHIVKSISEQVIDDWLSEQGIFHGYETPLDIGEDKPLKPDFCLKNYLGKGEDVYIEYFGLQGQPKYDEHTAYKMKHYERLGITVVCLYPKDSKNLKFALQTRVLNKEKIKPHKINN